MFPLQLGQVFEPHGISLYHEKYGREKRTGGRLIIHNRLCPPLILTPGGQICWESDRHPMILKARLISNYSASTLHLKPDGLRFNPTYPAFFLREGNFLIYGARSLTLE
jgi:hypothetical protein